MRLLVYWAPILILMVLGTVQAHNLCLKDLNPSQVLQRHKELNVRQKEKIQSIGLDPSGFLALDGQEGDVLLQLATRKVYKFFVNKYAFDRAINAEELAEPFLIKNGITLLKKEKVVPEFLLIVRSYLVSESLYQFRDRLALKDPDEFLRVQKLINEKLSQFYTDVKAKYGSAFLEDYYKNTMVGYFVASFGILINGSSLNVNLHPGNVFYDSQTHETTVVDIF
jgi:hypothetical protein